MVFENFHEVFLENNVGKTDDNIIAEEDALDASGSKTVHFNMISKEVTAPNVNNAFVVNMDPISISLENFQKAFYSCFDNYSYDYNTNNNNQDIYKLRKQQVCGKNIPFLKIVLELYKYDLGCDQLSPETEIKITNELANINDIRYICKKTSQTLTWKSLFNALLEQNDDDTMKQSDFLKKNHLFKLIFRVHNNNSSIRDIHFVFNFVVDFNGTSGLDASSEKYVKSIQSIVDEGGYTW